MELKDQYREFVLNAITADTPQATWQRIVDRAKATYASSYGIVASDPLLLDEQRAQKLFQERYFKMEHAIIAAARETGVAASAQLIGTNLCHYSYVARGRVGFTQSYVKSTGEMPSPAGFRKQLAEMAEFKRVSRLDLGDEPSELLTPKAVNGILLHSPVGSKFSKEQQMLGAIGFYVAYDDWTGWAVELTLPEILSAYQPTANRKDNAVLAFKRPTPKKTGTNEEEK